MKVVLTVHSRNVVQNSITIEILHSSSVQLRIFRPYITKNTTFKTQLLIKYIYIKYMYKRRQTNGIKYVLRSDLKQQACQHKTAALRFTSPFIPPYYFRFIVSYTATLTQLTFHHRCFPLVQPKDFALYFTRQYLQTNSIAVLGKIAHHGKNLIYFLVLNIKCF